ncbi:MAG: type II secretion system protein [Phycisphaerales bacterium JB040]
MQGTAATSTIGTHTHRTRHAFTIIELVVVVGIVALLVAITAVVGAGIVAGARGGKTSNAIKALEVSLTEYVSDRGNIPPATVLEPNPDRERTDDQKEIPVADAVFDVNYTEPGSSQPTPRLINSVGLYLIQLQESPGADAQIKSLSDEFLQLRPSYTPVSDTDLTGKADLGANADLAGIPTVLDGWGNPIRYVHPRFDGQIGRRFDDRQRGDAGTPIEVTVFLSGFEGRENDLGIREIRRNRIMKSEYPEIGLSQRDSDGAMCTNDRPYFYSAGADGDPSTIEDNVYSTEPNFTEPAFENN